MPRIRRAERSLCAFALFGLLASSATAVSPCPLPGIASLPGRSVDELLPFAEIDPALPSPQQVLGVGFGSRPLRAEEIERYFRALAAASPRASLLSYGTSHEGRPMVYLALSDEETLAHLDDFQIDHQRLSDPRLRPTSEDAAAVAGAKAVAWMGYSIHGDELTGADAAVALAYWLAAGRDERARNLRRDLLVFVDPHQNPDGRDRYLAQLAAFAHATPNPDQDDLSHTGVWPWGRGNHYLFDLNRDWFTLTQPESARSEVIARWLPQLSIDAHEMGPDDSFLFPPPRHPFNPHLPAGHNRWLERFAADQARALDERGFAYYTGEWNEEFFPGYGSTWSSYLGSIGVLYEMSQTDGTWVRQQAGTVRTFVEGIEHQLVSSVANLETLAAHRDEILLEFVRERRRAVTQGREAPVRAWILADRHTPERSDHLAFLLRRLGVEVFRTEEPIPPRGLHDIRTGEAPRSPLSAGSYLVPLDQPAGPMIRVLLDPHVPMESTFLREEREFVEKGKGSRLYEVTAWSLPLLQGVDAFWSEGPVDVPRVSPPSPASSAGRVIDDGSPYGYLLAATTDRAPAALADLLQRDLAVRYAEKPFSVAGRDFPRGTLLVKREGNPPQLRDELAAVADRWGVELVATPTALATSGPDLGGDHFLPLLAPRVGLLSGLPTSPSELGAIWHLLDATGLRANNLDVALLPFADLSRYNVLILPPTFGGPDSLRRMLGEGGVEALHGWIEAGGTAIGIGEGAHLLAAEDLAWAATRARAQALDRQPPPVFGIGALEAERAGPMLALGTPVRGGDGKSGPRPDRTSPYDVAPILGAGALPFAQGIEQGTPVTAEPVSLASWLAPLLPAGRSEPTAEELAAADARLRRFRPQGAILRLELEPEHWLTAGLPAEIDVLFREAESWIAEPPVEVVGRFASLDHLHLGGLLWPEAAGRLARTGFLTRESVGRGQVILFADNPAFRRWMPDAERLLLNAVLLGPGTGTDWPRPW